jgi:hypothetical protein
LLKHGGCKALVDSATFGIMMAQKAAELTFVLVLGE